MPEALRKKCLNRVVFKYGESLALIGIETIKIPMIWVVKECGVAESWTIWDNSVLFV